MLYLTGMRIEQFRNALIDPMPYYGEVLRRDSLNYRVNTVLGIRCCKEGKYSEAKRHLRNAINRSTQNYTRPKDREAFYYMGVVLQLQNRFEEAKDEFWKATWGIQDFSLQPGTNWQYRCLGGCGSLSEGG